MADENKEGAQVKSGRAARLASELRANLARRKAQARSRSVDEKQPAPTAHEAGAVTLPAEADE